MNKDLKKIILYILVIFANIESIVVIDYNRRVIKQKNNLINQKNVEIAKLKSQNEELWDIYYMNLNKSYGENYE